MIDYVNDPPVELKRLGEIVDVIDYTLNSFPSPILYVGPGARFDPSLPAPPHLRIKGNAVWASSRQEYLDRAYGVRILSDIAPTSWYALREISLTPQSEIDSNMVFYNGQPVTYNGEPVTFGV